MSCKLSVKEKSVSGTFFSAVPYILIAYSTVLCQLLSTVPSFTLSVPKMTIIMRLNMNIYHLIESLGALRV